MSSTKERIGEVRIFPSHAQLLIGETIVYCDPAQARMALSFQNLGYDALAVLDENWNVLDVQARD